MLLDTIAMHIGPPLSAPAVHPVDAHYWITTSAQILVSSTQFSYFVCTKTFNRYNMQLANSAHIEATVIGGTNSVRGYKEGVIGSGQSYVVGCGEISFPLFCSSLRVLDFKLLLIEMTISRS